MKDIDFLPDWYTSGKRRKIACRTQYVALAGIVAVMVVWNVIVGRSVTRAEAQIGQMVAQGADSDDASRRFDELKVQITGLQKQADVIGQVDSRVDVAGVLAELSYLIDTTVVLKRVDLIAEKFANAGKPGSPPVANSIVRAAKVPGSGTARALSGDVRFKILIGGIAADGGDVMSLVSRLEDSEYFFGVELSYSRNSQVKTGTGAAGQTSGVQSSKPGTGARSGNTIGVSEFEISCYLANYREL